MLFLKIFLFYLASVFIFFPLFVCMTRSPEDPKVPKFHRILFKIGFAILLIAILVLVFC